MNTPFRFRILAWIVILPVLLLACSSQAALPTSQPVHHTVTPPQPVSPPIQLREIPVADISVQIGVGSPIPVNVLISGSWPDLCAQLAEVHQEIKGSTVEIRLLATPKDEACPPDYLGLPFAFSIPINMAEMPQGPYTVIVNGVNTTFGWGSAAAQPLDDSTSAPASAPAAALFSALRTRAFRFTGTLRGRRNLFDGWRNQRGVEGLLVKIIQQHSQQAGFLAVLAFCRPQAARQRQEALHALGL